MLIHDDPNADNSADILSLIGDRQILPSGVFYCKRPLFVLNKSIVGEGTELRFPRMDAPYCLAWIGATNRIMSGITIVGPTQGECLGPTRSDRIYTHGLVIRDSSECKLFDVTVERVVCQGINIANATGLELRKVITLDTGRDGIFIRDSTDFFLDDCEANNTGDDAIALWSCSEALVQNSSVIQRVKADELNLRMGCGVRLGSCSHVTIRDTCIANTVKAGIHLMRDTYAAPGAECDFIHVQHVAFSSIAKYNGPLWPRQATGQIVTGKSTRVQISQ